jgi:hypothetical protein
LFRQRYVSSKNHKEKPKPGVVARACNPSYSGGSWKDWEDMEEDHPEQNVSKSPSQSTSQEWWPYL